MIRQKIWDNLYAQHRMPFTEKLRLTTKEWRSALLENNDKGYIIAGHVRRCKAKNLGFGVVEIELIKL